MKLRKNIKIILGCLIAIILISIGSLEIYKNLNKNDEINTIDYSEKNEETNKEPKIENYNLSLTMVGDALYHTGTYMDGLQSDGTYNYDAQLEYITPIIKNYDLAYYNQETILGGKELGLSAYPCFNSPTEVGDAYIKAGFNLVSLANNHSLDKGEKAILNSVSYWRKQENILTAGSYDSYEDRNRSHIGEKNGITYAFLSYTYGTNGIPIPNGKNYLVNLFSKEQAEQDIKELRNKVDIIIVAMHWGIEYTHVPTYEERDQAEFLANLGVDIIIGTHPHVIQPIEYIGNTVVFYSLGNFISGQDGIEKRIGMIGSLEINKTVIDNITKEIKINNVKGDLLYTYHNSKYRNNKVIPFANLTNNELPNYETIYEKYKLIINKTNDERISIGI